VLADGQTLPPGTYQLRLGEWVQPVIEGMQQGMQRVEFVSGGRVVGRDVAEVIPDRDIGAVSEWHPPPGSIRVDRLRSDNFVRIWLNRSGTHYLIHLPGR
jgi:hypothetical protein